MKFLFSSCGVPYVCPNNSYRAILFTESGTLQFLVKGVLSDTINNANVSSGICFESQNTTYFAYSAAYQQHYNVYMYTTSLDKSTTLYFLTSACKHTKNAPNYSYLIINI